MKIDFDQPVLDLDGEAIDDPNSKAEPKAKLTLKEVAIRALVSPTEDDRNLSPEQSFKNYELARKIHAGGEQEIEPEQASLIRARLNKAWVIEVSGFAYEKFK